MKRKIAVVTGTRAEYGILKPLIRKIKNSPNLDLSLIVTGMHLIPQFGSTYKEILRDGFTISHKVYMYNNKSNKALYHADALSCGIVGFAEVLNKTKPSILVVFGDRLEPLAATLAGAMLKIPVAHIHGGDKTDSGHIDESIRNSISQFAHIHFTATKSHSQRLIRMGEEPWRIFQTGALGLDSSINEKSMSKRDLFNKLKINNKSKTMVCLFHPNDIELKMVGNQMREILESIKEIGIQTVIIFPNNDVGSHEIIKEIKKIKMNFVRIYKSLPHITYTNLLRHADVLIGNSSSGIIEAPTFGLPAVNIGLRNTGREHGNNVIFVSAERKKIIKAVKMALLDKKFRLKAKKGINPYGGGNVSKKITNILNKIKINERLMRKVKTI